MSALSATTWLALSCLILFGCVGLGLFIALLVYAFSLPPNCDWQLTYAMFSKKDATTGRRIRGHVMVRKVNGRKIYRELAPEEADTYLATV